MWLKNSLDKFDEFNYVVEQMIASEAYPDFVGAYCKGTLTPKASSSDSHRINRVDFHYNFHYRGISLYRIQNGKMVETWHVVDGFPSLKK
jgi:hypothetical protein